MPSPAQRHQMRVLAAQGAANAAPGTAATSAVARAQALINVQLDADRRHLKAVQSKARKIALKRQMLPNYEPYVEGVLQGGDGAPDEVLGYVLVWRLDVEDYAGAFAIGRYLIEHGLDLPDRFKRSAAAYIAEETAVAALAAYRDEQPFDVDVLREAIALTDGQDMHDEVKAKALFALGRHLRATRPVEALELLLEAVRHHEGVGAKKDIEQLRTLIKNNPELSTPVDS